MSMVYVSTFYCIVHRYTTIYLIKYNNGNINNAINVKINTTMCCWSVKVTVTVTGNLVLRVCAELTDAVCKLFLPWWCGSSSTYGTHKSPGNDLASIQNSPWYSNIDRKTSETILREQTFDGAFIVRPSSNPDNICSLSVLQDGLPFHINVRQRPDGWLALGTSKANEHCFATVHDIVEFYKKETLVINSCGEKYLTVLKELQLSELNQKGKEQEKCEQLSNLTQIN